ncbi:MAG: BON domain-containing protein [Rhodoferax sp.]|nr:BON domain-containing protein [Rhodoferax sp.]
MTKNLHRLCLRPLMWVALLSASVLSLSGCFPLAAGGAIMTGFVAADRRSAGAQLEDQNIEIKAANQIRQTIGERGHINITSYNRQVLISGEVPSAQDQARAEQLVKAVDNVSIVLNELAVMGNTTLTERSNDVITAGRIKAAVFDAQDLTSSAFKITVERGVVYVLGRVTAREAKRVTEVITAVPGVRKVVRVLEVITEEDLARIAPPPSEPKKTAP